MDLSLTVKSEFDNVYNESLEKALKYYLKPETLEGDNLYFCEKCNEKVIK
jgi:ubiquitin carboxyl-terminal hydrolase 47